MSASDPKRTGRKNFLNTHLVDEMQSDALSSDRLTAHDSGSTVLESYCSLMAMNLNAPQSMHVSKAYPHGGRRPLLATCTLAY